MRKIKMAYSISGVPSVYALTTYGVSYDAWSAGCTISNHECRLCAKADADAERRSRSLGMFARSGKPVFRLSSPDIAPVSPEKQRLYDYITEQLELLNRTSMVPPRWRLIEVEYGECVGTRVGAEYSLMLKFCAYLPGHLRSPELRQCLVVDVILDLEKSSLPFELVIHANHNVCDGKIDIVCIQFCDNSYVRIAERNGYNVVRALEIKIPAPGDRPEEPAATPRSNSSSNRRVDVTITEYEN